MLKVCKRFGGKMVENSSKIRCASTEVFSRGVFYSGHFAFPEFSVCSVFFGLAGIWGAGFTVYFPCVVEVKVLLVKRVVWDFPLRVFSICTSIAYTFLCGLRRGESHLNAACGNAEKTKLSSKTHFCPDFRSFFAVKCVFSLFWGEYNSQPFKMHREG